MIEHNFINKVWKGTEFWSNQIKSAGVYDKLAYFNDVIVEKNPPHSESEYHLILNDIILDGKHCDIYHTDQDESGNKIRNSSYHRIFIHTKD